MSLRIFIGVFCALVLSVASGEEKEKSPFEVLKTTDGFYDTAVGFAGVTPDEVIAFRSILGQENADSLFKKLLKEATLGGQLYGLCGVYYTDPDAFATEVERYAKSKKTVKTMMGCIVMEMKVSTLVCQEIPGIVRLESREQSIKEWADAHRAELKTGMRYDIAGGGWPNKFKAEGGYREIATE